MAKRDIEPRDEDIIDLENAIEPRNRRKEEKEKLFLYDDRSLSEALDQTLNEIQNQVTTVKIPKDIYNQLDLKNNKTVWEALKKYMLKEYENALINKITWEINEEILREPEPELIERNYNDNGRIEPIYIEQPGDLAEFTNYGYIHNLDNNKRISRLAEVYYVMHQEAMKRAYYRHMPNLKELENKVKELSEIKESEIEERTRQLSEKIKDLDNKYMDQKIKANMLREIIEEDKKEYEKGLQAKEKEYNERIEKLKREIEELKGLLHYRKLTKYKISNFKKLIILKISKTKEGIHSKIKNSKEKTLKTLHIKKPKYN